MNGLATGFWKWVVAPVELEGSAGGRNAPWSLNGAAKAFIMKRGNARRLDDGERFLAQVNFDTTIESMTNSPTRLFILAALDCEARPIARRLDLRRSSESTPRPVYLGEGITLAVAGVGRRAVETAVRFLHLYEAVNRTRPDGPEATDRSEAAWLNIGIGGHRDRPLGEVVLAHRIEDGSEAPPGTRFKGRSVWFPRFVFAPPCATETVRTVDRVEDEYPEPVIYEMEAAGFMASASKLASAELVHVMKIVSDGLNAPVRGISGRMVENLMESRAETIDAVARTLIALAGDRAGRHAAPPGWNALRNRWRFTETQSHQLRRLLVRWSATYPGVEPEAAELGSARTSREVVAFLEAVLSRASPAPDRRAGTDDESRAS